MPRRTETVCDLCGKAFDFWDDQEDFKICYDNVGYGSAFDTSSIECHMCCACFDALMKDYILPKAKFQCVEEVDFFK